MSAETELLSAAFVSLIEIPHRGVEGRSAKFMPRRWESGQSLRCEMADDLHDGRISVNLPTIEAHSGVLATWRCPRNPAYTTGNTEASQALTSSPKVELSTALTKFRLAALH